MLQGGPKVNLSWTYVCPYCLTRGVGELEANTIRADLEPLPEPRVFSYTRWSKDWVKVSIELAQDRCAWSASVRDRVNSIGDAGSTRPE